MIMIMTIIIIIIITIIITIVLIVIVIILMLSLCEFTRELVTIYWAEQAQYSLVYFFCWMRCHNFSPGPLASGRPVADQVWRALAGNSHLSAFC